MAWELNHIVDPGPRHLASELVDHQHDRPHEISGAAQIEREAPSVSLRRFDIGVVPSVPVFEQITAKGDGKIELRHGGVGS